jgi:hypothetical protein
MNEIVKTSEATTTELVTLAEQINAEHRSFVGSLKKTAEHGIRAGELLTEAKSKCKHGKWLPWLDENFEGAPRTAQEYMRLYSHRDEIRAKTRSSAHLSISGALKEIASPHEEGRTSDRQDNGNSAPTALAMDGHLGRFMVEVDRPFPGEAHKQEDELVSGQWRPTLVVWGAERVLLAGYNVYPLCVKHGMPFEVEEKDFESEFDAVMWAIWRRMIWAGLLPFMVSPEERRKVFGRIDKNPLEYVQKLESKARRMLELEGNREKRKNPLSRVLAEDVVRNLAVWDVDYMMVELGMFGAQQRSA